MLFFLLLINNFALKYVYVRPHFQITISQFFPNVMGIGDFNNNGFADLALMMTDTVEYDQKGIYFLEYKPDSGFIVRDSIMAWHLYASYENLCGIGDFDDDGKTDMAVEEDSIDLENGKEYTWLKIYESPDSFSYPVVEVWRDTQRNENSYSPYDYLIDRIYDVDKDNIPELFAHSGGNRIILKSTTDNLYDTLVYDTFFIPLAFGYFDPDSFVDGINVFGGDYYISENIDMPPIFGQI